MYIQPEGLTRGTHQLQTKHTNRFLFSIDGDPTTKLLVKEAPRPSVSFEDIEIPHINKYRYEIGRPRYESLNITMMDYVTPSTAQYVSAWLATQSETWTGKMGYSIFYRRRCTLEVMGGVNDVVERWDYFNCHIVSADFGTMSWDSEEPVQINLSIRYDDFIHRF